MRLTLQERSAIAEAARATLAAGTQVSLFGSRTDDQARGGDIDPLVETPLPMPAKLGVTQSLGSGLDF